jgi:hypothetical protein
VSLLDEVLTTLRERIKTVDDNDLVLQAFAAWIAFGAEGGHKSLVQTGETMCDAQQYQDVSVLGFLLARNPTNRVLASNFVHGIEWLSSRRFFKPTQPLSFEFDGIAILGVAIGLTQLDASEHDSHLQWLAGLIAQSLSRTARSDIRNQFNSGVLALAAVLLPPVPNSHVTLDSIPADLRVAMAAIGLLQVADADESDAYDTIMDLNALEDIPPEKAIVRLVALQWIARKGATLLPGRIEPESVRAMVARLEHALKRWPWEIKAKTARQGAEPQKWDIQNEYHVQSLLWTVLAPVFSDLEDEEYLASLGFKHPRADLAIPSIRLIVEVKFTREGTNSAFAELTGQIASDSVLYLKQPSAFESILVVVWDDTASVHRHQEARDGMNSIPGILDTIILSRPGEWLPKSY